MAPPSPRTTPPGSDSAPSGAPANAALLQCLLDGKRDPVTVYNAVQEIRTMSGEVVVAKLTTLIETRFAEVNGSLAETNARMEARFAALDGRLHSVEVQLRVIWTLLIPLVLALVGAAIGIAIR